MKVVVSGGTGFLGGALVERLRTDGYQVTVLTRSQTGKSGHVQWHPRLPLGPWASAIDGADAVINLAGAPIADGRWTEDRKRSILESRVHATQALVAAIKGASAPPPTFLSGSAIGFYGTHASQELDETSPPGSDFLANVYQEWEDHALEAARQTRVVLLRTGIALGRNGGALKPLALPFHFFAGGPIGSGRQYMSWIHREDWIELVRWALTTPAVSGPLNLTAPAPVTNAEMAATLGRVLHRPSSLPAPAFALRLALGEMADAMILNGQRVLPYIASRGGFTFRYKTLDPALREIYKAE